MYVAQKHFYEQYKFVPLTQTFNYLNTGRIRVPNDINFDSTF